MASSIHVAINNGDLYGSRGEFGRERRANMSHEIHVVRVVVTSMVLIIPRINREKKRQKVRKSDRDEN